MKSNKPFRRTKSASVVEGKPTPAEYDQSERRRLNRRTGGVFSETATTSPLTRKMTPDDRPEMIAIAGAMLAAGELDRLSVRAENVARQRMIERQDVPKCCDSPVTAPPNTPVRGRNGSLPVNDLIAGGGSLFYSFAPSNTPVSGFGTSTMTTPGQGYSHSPNPSRTPVSRLFSGFDKLDEGNKNSYGILESFRILNAATLESSQGTREHSRCASPLSRLSEEVLTSGIQTNRAHRLFLSLDRDPAIPHENIQGELPWFDKPTSPNMLRDSNTATVIGSENVELFNVDTRVYDKDDVPSQERRMVTGGRAARSADEIACMDGSDLRTHGSYLEGVARKDEVEDAVWEFSQRRHTLPTRAELIRMGKVTRR